MAVIKYSQWAEEGGSIQSFAQNQEAILDSWFNTELNSLEFNQSYGKMVALQSGTNGYQNSFAVAVTIHQGIENRVKEQNQFLSQISNIMVPYDTGGKLTFDITGTISRRNAVRVPIDPGIDGQKLWSTAKYQADTKMPWQDQYIRRRAGDWLAEHMSAKTKAIANERLQVCFNGTSRALDGAAADLVNLTDLDIGWEAQLVTRNQANVLNKIVALNTTINIGVTGDFPNLEVMINAAIGQITAESGVSKSELVVLLGSNVAVGYGNIYWGSQAGVPTEKLKILEALNTVAGLRPLAPDRMKPNSVWVTTLKNLGFLHQKDTMMRKFAEDHTTSSWVDFLEYYGTPWLENEFATKIFNNIAFV